MYSDLRGFATAVADDIKRDDLLQMLVDPLLQAGATLVTPTFTYTTSGRFEVTETQTRLGALNKWMLKQSEVRRSEHPLFSDAALGPQAEIVENVGKSAFGRSSVFDRLRDRHCGFLHLGHDLETYGNTIVHYVEQQCGATYRIQKAFPTKVYRDGGYVGTDYTAFLRRRDVPLQDFATDFHKATDIMRDRGLLQEVGDAGALRHIIAYNYDESVELMAQLFYEDPNVFIGTEFIQYRG